MDDFIYRSATDLAALIRSGQATSQEIVKAHLDHIKKHNPALNAVVILLEEEALETARACDEEARRGEFRGPLHGVPITVKEQFWLKGAKSTLNVKMFKDWVAPEDAVVVDRLKQAGAVILGKTNVPRNLLDFQVWGDIYPEGKNPYNPDHSPGGSSGGSAAALASGMVAMELGGDFGGSTRIPSHFCGLYGIKPTEATVPGHGMVPRPEGAKGHVFHMAVPGPMARTIEDMELGWEIIRGPHHSDRITPRIDWHDASSRELRDYRVAWVDAWPGHEPSEKTRALIQKFVQELGENGCKVEEATIPGDLHRRSLAVWLRIFGLVIAQDVPWFVRPLMRMQLKSTVFKDMKDFLDDYNRGFKHTFLNYSEAMGIRAGIISEWEQFFERYDLLVCPMSHGPAFKRCKMGSPIAYDGKTVPYGDYCWPYVGCFNATGHPAMNIPLGLGDEGLPVGVQVVGPYWSEPELIRFAKLVSAWAGGFVRPPGC